MTNLRVFLYALPPVKALRAAKWRRLAFSGMPRKKAVAAAERDADRRQALLGAYRRSDPAAAEAERQFLAAGVSARTAEDALWYRFAYGFSSAEYRCYGFAEKTRAERLAYFSDRESVRLSYRLNDPDAMGLFSDKWKTYDSFRSCYRRAVVRIFAEDDYAAFARFLKAHPVFIAKPARGSCGAGVRKIDASGGADPRKLFDSLLTGGRTVLEEPIAQSPALASFHPGSVNTVRVVTFRGKDGVRPLWAFLKTGRGGSLTDNGAAGGVMAGIDLAAGRVDTQGVDEAGRRYAVHPDTGAPYEGFVLPEWRALTELCVSLASEAPRVRMIGWDAAHTGAGWCIVEGNAQSELIGPQAVSGRGLREEILRLLEENDLPTEEYRA